MDLRSSTTTDKAFQHFLKAPPLITKSVFKLKMMGVNFSMFCEKLQNVLTRWTTTDAIFGLSVPQNSQIRYKLQLPKNPVSRCNKLHK